MKFQQAVYPNNSNISRNPPSLAMKRVKSSYIRNNKSKLSGIFRENLVPENAICSKILIKEKILCSNQNNNNANFNNNNNFCFEDCPNFLILKKLEKDLKDLIESNINLKKMNEYLLKTISIKDDLFIDVKNENKNLKVDNNILNAHIGSKRILSGRQCQIRNSFKSSFASEFCDITQNPINCSSLNTKKASQPVISASTLNNFNNKDGNNMLNFNGNGKSTDFSGSLVKKKRKDISSNSKEVQIRGNSGFSKSNSLNTFLNLASKQKKKNAELNSNNHNVKGINIEFANDISLKVSNSIQKSHLNQELNASTKNVFNNNNNSSNNNLSPNFIMINNNKNLNNEQQTLPNKFSSGSLISKQTSQDASPNNQPNSYSSNSSKHQKVMHLDLNSNQNIINNNNNNFYNNNSCNNCQSNNNNNINKINKNNNVNYDVTSSCGNSIITSPKQHNFYEQISNLVSKNNKNLKFKNKARSSLLGLNDETLAKIISNEVIINLKKITLNDEEFVEFFRTTSEDKLISYCDAIYQLIRDVESAVKLVQRMREYIIITASLANCSLIEEILAFIIKDACKIMDCERTSIFMYDNLSDMLVVHTGEGLKRNEIRLPKNVGIIGSVFLKGEIIRVDDAYADSRFNNDFDRKSNYVTKSILAAPLKDSSGVSFGVIQSINKNNNAKFTDDDEELIHLFSLHISQIMKSAKTNDQNISYIAKLKMIISFKEQVLKIENLLQFSSCIENIIMNVFASQCSQILIFNEQKNKLVKISKYEISEKNKNIGIVGYVFERKEFFGINSSNGCQFFNNLVDIETGMSTLTYPIVTSGNVKAILQFAYNDKLIHFKKPQETDEEIIKYILFDCEKWFVKNEEIVKSYFTA